MPRRSAAVAPPDERGRGSQVIVGSVAPDRHQGDSQPGQRLGIGRQRHIIAPVDPGGSLNCLRIAAGVGAVPGQRGGFARVGVGVGEAMPDLGMLGDETQRLALALSTDEDRYRPGGGRVELGQP